MNEILKQKLLEMDYLGSIMSQLSWDESTLMPSKAMPIRGDINAFLSGMIQEKSTDPELKTLIQELAKQPNLDDMEKAIVKNFQKKEHYYSVLPQEFYQELSKSFSEGQQAWEEARKQNDFSIYAPKLERNITLTKKLARALGEFTTPYDALLNVYEEGLNSTYLDEVFEVLKNESIRILNENKNKEIKALPKAFYSKAKQEEMMQELLNLIQFDLDAGCLAETTHPFCNASQVNDVRLAIRYNEKDFTEAMYALLHEGGHGLYEQNINPDLYGTGLCSGVAMSIHESCSRMIENQVGRSFEFISYYFDRLCTLFPELKEITAEDFYQIVNKQESSLIRIHADEVSYNLHIIIRYEMEKLMINEDIDVYELPKIWNQKYEDYLGIKPKDDLEGIMQDIHWSCILIGYFPSYTLGSIYATQLFDTFKKSNIVDYHNGTINDLVAWMKENIYQHGSLYAPNTLIKKATGSELNVQPFLDYLRNK